MLDWGLRLVVLLSVPCAVALLVFAQPLVAVLYHYGAFSDLDVQRTTTALSNYGVGLMGIVAVKVLAPGFYARHDMRTPMRIAVVRAGVHAGAEFFPGALAAACGLTLSIAIGALINALWLLLGLLRRGSYKPVPGWGVFALQVGGASALLAAFLLWAAGAVNWVGLKGHSLERIGWLALVLLVGAAVFRGAVGVRPQGDKAPETLTGGALQAPERHFLDAFLRRFMRK
jgi:putative peptidoglycan lipid II flippase